MRHMEGMFTGYRNLELFYQHWLPTKEPKAIIILVHGLRAHSGCYLKLNNYLLSKGYAIYSFDLRGHGKSEGIKGHVDNFSDYVYDLQVFINRVRSERGGYDIFVIGISMGGTITLDYALENQNQLVGLIAAGAFLRPDVSVSPLLIQICTFLSLTLPKMRIGSFDISVMSKDKLVVHRYTKDPLYYKGKITARLGSELLEASKKLQPQISSIKLPILIMHGTADRLANLEGSITLCESVGSIEKTLKLYDGAYHDIFNDLNNEQVFSDLNNWLYTHILGLPYSQAK